MPIRDHWKLRVIILFIIILVSAACALAQTFKAVSSKKAVLQVSDQQVYAEGHWIVLGDDAGHLSGPAVSEISCMKSTKVCTEHKANFEAFPGGLFSLSADQNTYDVERWTDHEVVASMIRGVCRIRRTLKFDLTDHTLLAMEAL